MKKKKKKVVALDLDESPAPAEAAPAEEEPVATGTSTPEPSAADDKPAEDAGDMFADLKKKKKKKKDIPLDLEGGEAPAGDATDVPIVKKKKKKPAADFAAEVGGECDCASRGEEGAGKHTARCSSSPPSPPVCPTPPCFIADISSTSLTPRRLPRRTLSTCPQPRRLAVSTPGLPRTVTPPTPSC